jgi:hypothetical protein
MAPVRLELPGAQALAIPPGFYFLWAPGLPGFP